MRKQAFCICENKDADQLHVNCDLIQKLSTPELLPGRGLKLNFNEAELKNCSILSRFQIEDVDLISVEA